MAAGVEVVRWSAADRDLFRVFHDGFDALKRYAAEAPDKNVAEAEALCAHRRAIGKSEDVVGRHVERFSV